MPRKLLALDVATNTGFAFGEVAADTRPLSGVIRFGAKGCVDDDSWRAALVWLHDQIKVLAPDVVAIEAPIMSSQAAGGTNAQTMVRLLGLQAVLRTVVAVNLPVAAKLIHVQSARKAFIGRGNLPGAEAKRLVRQKCIDLGWLTEDSATFDKADAMCVWAKAASDLDPSIRWQFEPLAQPAG